MVATLKRIAVSPWLLVPLCIALVAWALITGSESTVVRFQTSNSHSDYYKVYWTTDTATHWSEKRSSSIRVNSRKKHHLMVLDTPITKIEKLRIDPGRRKGVEVQLSEVSLYSLLSQPVRFIKGSLNQLKPNSDVAELKRSKTKLKFKVAGNDPSFLTTLPELALQTKWQRIAQAVVLGLVLFVVLKAFSQLLPSLRFVPVVSVFVLALVITMSTLTKPYKHPDESIHLKNAQFYQTHWLPVEVCAKESLYTYSSYGISRLNNRENAYYLGGRYLQLVDFVPASDLIKLRFFNVAMLALLAFLAIKHLAFRFAMLPLLMTPQAWYLFSYYNSDAFSLFTMMMLAYQLVVQQSMLRRSLRGEGSILTRTAWALLLALLALCLFWFKINYMFYPLFLLSVACGWWLVHRKIPRMPYIWPTAITLVLAISVFSGWEFNRHAMNNFETKERIFSCHEKMAEHQYKPSTPKAQMHPNLHLRDRGVSLSDMLTQKDWFVRIGYTALGAYGATEYLATNEHYELVTLGFALFVLYLTLMLLIKGDNVARLALLSAIGTIFGILLASAWTNWNDDFQPQGRYLMVLLPIWGTLLAFYSRKFSTAVLSWIAVIPILLGLYSFIAIGLVEISKI